MLDHGWFGEGNRRQLDRLVTVKTRTIIEVGTWLGMSAFYMAERMSPSGKIYCVDLWENTPQVAHHLEALEIPSLYHQFLSNVIHRKKTDMIVPVKLSSIEASSVLAVKADVIYIDASHDQESVRQDVVAWSRHLKPGGVICGDDWGVERFQVSAGVYQAMTEVPLHGLQNDEAFWWAQMGFKYRLSDCSKKHTCHLTLPLR